MPIFVSWKVEKRIMYVQFIGDVTFEEIGKANDEQVALIRQGIAPVHQITNFTQAGYVPLHLKEASENTSFFAEPKLGWVLNVGVPNRSVQFVSSILSQKTESRLRQLNSEDECMVFLHENDPSL